MPDLIQANDFDTDDRKRLAGLLAFAEGVLNARSPVQMDMRSGLGLFRETEIAGLPGLTLDGEDEAWLAITRQRETLPPEAPDLVRPFLAAPPADPARMPQLKPATQLEISVEDASDLAEAGLLAEEDIEPIVEEGVRLVFRVRAVLHTARFPEMRADFEGWAGGLWAEWAAAERPVRRAIALYNDLFKLHAAMHTAEGTPPELVWGLGIGRWQSAGATIDMPLIEQPVDLEIADDGTIVLRPRDVDPTLSLKPYIEIGVPGAAALQVTLRDRLALLLQEDAEITPFSTAWEPLLFAAAANLSGTAVHVPRAEIAAGAALEPAGARLRLTSHWAIFGRPRSSEARLQDLNSLRRGIETARGEIPASIRGFVSPAPEQPAEIADFGLDTARLGGSGWQVPGQDGARTQAVAGAGTEIVARDPQRVHFFPLPFNEDQARIADMIDDPALAVVCVSGPPGTGKSHSIANIISHQMAMGRRVLVTARTPEAIAAVREKLPPALRSLVIASVGTDRDSVQQLEDAVDELSRTVVSLDIAGARRDMARLEEEVIACDRIAAEADRQLAAIARANLTDLDWQGQRLAPMALAEALAEAAPGLGWFTDRPETDPPADLDPLLARLASSLPELARDTAYAGATLPDPGDLPGSAELIEAHRVEAARTAREIVDYSAAPRMARDTAAAETEARQVLQTLEDTAPLVARASSAVRDLARQMLRADRPLDAAAVEAVLRALDAHGELELIAGVSFELGACAPQDFLDAARRGASGQKPVGFSLFNGALKAAVASARVEGRVPLAPSDWADVVAACRLDAAAPEIARLIAPLTGAGRSLNAEASPAVLARQLADIRADILAARAIAGGLGAALARLARLFPYGLDFHALRETLDPGPALFALRGNLDLAEAEPAAIVTLRRIAGDSPLPVLAALRELATALGQPGTTPEAILDVRGEITAELARLAAVAPRLAETGRDLQALRRAGAPDWVARLEADPEAAATLIPADWHAAWAWGCAMRTLDAIVALGNGDRLRADKAAALRRRARHFEELIRIRTLLGLKRRMTAPIRQALEAFTQAISRIGTGKGKRAPRFIRAAQEAARQASAAAPVWIMPEYKIPEQLPAAFGDFDLVILDEASQSDLTAIAALARGRKILVVGDEEQVSPSVVGIQDEKVDALRAQFLAELPNATLIDQNTSVFEMTKRMHPDSHVMLREHFRCVAPIIQFSTRFYANALIPLRVPRASERFDPPLVDVYIPGATRQGKTNASEARWIVEEIARLIADPAHAGRDIGVISLIGAEQAEKIGRMLIEDPRIGPSAISERRIICGDARTMQGQERSVVFLSMVATPSTATAQAGKGDQQRINVAMSRARDRLYLVRSVRLEELKPTDIKAQVLAHFADPMPEGRAVSGTEIDDLLDRCDSGFEREVLDRLLQAGFRARPQVPAGGFRIDIVVEGAEDRRLAIELDGDTFHGPDVWEEDMARQAALERAGWVFWRVFGSQWRADPELWWQDLLASMARLGIGPIGAGQVDERFTETIVVGAPGPGDAAAPALQAGPAVAAGAAQPGSRVRLAPAGGAAVEVTLVAGGGTAAAGLVGTDTALGRALLDAEAGDEIEYSAGDRIERALVLEVV